jgi:hypothetical protein
LDVTDGELDLDVPCRSYRHNRRFLEVIGVMDLRHFFYKKVGSKPMEELTRVLNSSLAPSRELRDIIWVFVFAHGARCSDQVIPADSTHAISVFSRTADGMAHRYFERVDANFREIPELAVTVKAVPDLDDIRLLHFAAFGLGELPAQSTFYEFKAEYWGVEHLLHLFDSTLRTALLLDAEKLAGAPAIGLNGDEIYTALLRQPQGGEEGNCGNSTSCGAGSGSCEPVPSGLSAGYYCKTGVNGDTWVGVFTEAIRASLASLDEVDFPAARALITEFLPRSQLGRQFMAYYYVASSNCAVRHDRRALEEYVRALPIIRKCLHELLYGPDDAIVVTEDLRAAWARIASLHQGVRLPAQQRMDRTMRQLDLARMTTKADLLRMLETDGSALAHPD